MPRLKIRGFRGAERCDINLDAGITLLAGKNHQGKSSICQAIAAAVCNTAIPFYSSTNPSKPVLTKTQAKGIVRAGMDKASVELWDGEKMETQVLWPKGTIQSTERYACSKVAAGLINPMELEEGTRQRFFASLLDSDPGEDDINAALKDAGVMVENIHHQLSVQGWDVLHKSYAETGARLKGQWEAHAGGKYGSNKAADWRPDGWRSELDAVTLEGIGTIVSQAQDAVEKAVSALAVDSADIERLTSDAAKEKEALDKIHRAEPSRDMAKQDLEAATVAHKAIRVPSAVPCPACGVLLDIFTPGSQKHADMRTLTESKTSAAQREEIHVSLTKAIQRLEKAEAALLLAQRPIDDAKIVYNAVKGAGARLEAVKARKGTQEAVDVARDYLRGVQADQARVRAVLETVRIGAEVASNQRIIDMLAPDGLRRQKLVQALAVFNQSQLAPLSAAASFPTVTVDEGLSVLYGGRPYYLLSESEKYRVRAVLQVAVAAIDQSPIVIMDGADILDSPGRNGLVQMLAGLDQLISVVAMTITHEAEAPDFGAAGLGQTVWVDGGIARSLAPEALAA